MKEIKLASECAHESVQFKQPDGSSTKEKAEIKQIEVNNLPVTLMFETATHLKPGSPMMIGGQVRKLPNYAMQAGAFNKFVKSFKAN